MSLSEIVFYIIVSAIFSDYLVLTYSVCRELFFTAIISIQFPSSNVLFVSMSILTAVSFVFLLKCPCNCFLSFLIIIFVFFFLHLLFYQFNCKVGCHKQLSITLPCAVLKYIVRRVNTLFHTDSFYSSFFAFNESHPLIAKLNILSSVALYFDPVSQVFSCPG